MNKNILFNSVLMGLGLLLSMSIISDISLIPYPIHISLPPNWVFGMALGFIFIGIRHTHLAILTYLPTKLKWFILLLFYLVLVGLLVWFFQFLFTGIWGINN